MRSCSGPRARNCRLPGRLVQRSGRSCPSQRRVTLKTHGGPVWLARSSHERLDDDMSELTGWDSFYVIVGSAAGALIGLQFVVMTLIAERPPIGAPKAVAAFGTPTIVHFAVVLLLSAVVSVPWDGMATVAVLWGFVGLIGVV